MILEKDKETMMKKLCSLLIALTLLMSLAACGSKDNGNAGESDPDTGIVTPEEDGTNTPDAPESGTEDDSTQTPEEPPATGPENTTKPPSSGGSASTKPGTGGTTNKPSGGSSNKPSGGASGGSSNSGSSSADKGDLTTLMGKLMGDSAGEMSVSTEEISADAFKANLFIDYMDGAKAVSNTAMMSSVGHSVCLLKVPDGTDAAKVAEQINQNKDPRKWVCVEAEKAVVLQKGNYILLAMSTTDIVNTVSANFKKVF